MARFEGSRDREISRTKDSDMFIYVAFIAENANTPDTAQIF